MTAPLFTEYISTAPNAKTLLLFGGNAQRRHEIISLLQPLRNLSVYGALSEAEGMEKIKTLSQIDIVLIGGRYSEAERLRIRNFLHTNYPAVKITEPGYQYLYSNEAIFTNVQNIINNETTQ